MNERQDTEIGQLPGEWELKTLLDVASPTKKAIISGPFGSNISRKYFVESGVPVIRGNNLDLDIGTKFVDDGFVFVTEEKAESLNTWATVNDLVFTAAGTIGQVGLITGNQKYSHYIISNKQLRATLDHKKINPLFAYYWFASDLVQQLIVRRNTGSTIPLINLSVLKSLPVPLPSLREQEAITAVLASLDDKIDLLHRQNKTLESLAQTLFRHWFIDGAEDDWEERPLDEVADYLNGLACQKYPPENEAERLPVLKIKELRNGLSDQSDWATSNVSDEYIVENGDVIFSWSGSLMVKIWDGTSCVLNQHLFKVTSAEFPKWFYYLWTIYHLEKFIAIAASKATTMGHIKRGDLSNSMVLIPSQQELEKMDRAIAPLLDKLILNNRQIAKLTALRDTLLPKLMSGEVRVRLRQQN